MTGTEKNDNKNVALKKLMSLYEMRLSLNPRKMIKKMSL